MLILKCKERAEMQTKKYYGNIINDYRILKEFITDSIFGFLIINIFKSLVQKK